MSKAKEFKPPKSLAACADLLYTTREARLKLDKEVTALKAKETVLRNYLIDNLPKSEATGVAGKVARATVVVKEEPLVKDQVALRRYLNKTKRWDLVNNLRCSAPAIREIWDDGKEIPGVEHFNNVTISLNKV